MLFSPKVYQRYSKEPKPRDHRTLLQHWSSLKRAASKADTAYKASLKATGGGENNVPPPSELQYAILAACKEHKELPNPCDTNTTPPAEMRMACAQAPRHQHAVIVSDVFEREQEEDGVPAAIPDVSGTDEFISLVENATRNEGTFAEAERQEDNLIEEGAAFTQRRKVSCLYSTFPCLEK